MIQTRRACVLRRARCHTQAIPLAEDAGLFWPATRAIPSVPNLLSSLLHRTRTGILVLLIGVLPLQGVTQLVAGVQAHRHVHTGLAAPASLLSELTRPLRVVLDRLHAGQDPRLLAPRFAWLPSQGPAAGYHQHGGVFHKHGHDTADAVDVGDAGDGAQQQAAATAFLAWLPVAFALPLGEGCACPAMAACDWPDRVIAPPLTPPRG